MKAINREVRECWRCWHPDNQVVSIPGGRKLLTELTREEMESGGYELDFRQEWVLRRLLKNCSSRNNGSTDREVGNDIRDAVERAGSDKSPIIVYPIPCLGYLGRGAEGLMQAPIVDMNQVDMSGKNRIYTQGNLQLFLWMMQNAVELHPGTNRAIRNRIENEVWRVRRGF